jgi:hypothetical protein
MPASVYTLRLPLSEAARILNLTCKVWQEQDLKEFFKLVVTDQSHDLHCPAAGRRV